MMNFLHMPRIARAAVALAALAVLSGCASRAIVLVPDPEGRVGRAEVATAGGTRVLEKAGDMTLTSGPSNPPSQVVTADPGFIAKTFREALAIEPPPPAAFTLMFETGGTVLTPDSARIVERIVAEVRERTALSVRVSGHTDATGSDRLNDALALDRANAVRALLVERGVREQTISVSSHGKGNPAVPTPVGVAEPRNRRVVVVVR